MDFSPLESKIICQAPEYMRNGLRIAKILRNDMFAGTLYVPEDVITSFMLKTCLLRVLLKHREKTFAGQTRLLDTCTCTCISQDEYLGLSWAILIYRELSKIFKEETVDFHRIYQQLANDLFPDTSFQHRNIFSCAEGDNNQTRSQIYFMTQEINGFLSSEMLKNNIVEKHIEDFFVAEDEEGAFNPGTFFAEMENIIECLCLNNATEITTRM